MSTSTVQRDAEPSHLDRGQRPGDILLFNRATGLAHVITLLTRSPYYHAAIADEGLRVVEARPKGVVHGDLREKRRGHEFVVLRVPSGAGRAALDWALSQVGDRYDDTDAIVIFLEHIFRWLRINYKPPRNRFTCAEFVATAFRETGTDLFPGEEPADAVPADFARFLPELRLVERGGVRVPA